MTRKKARLVAEARRVRVKIADAMRSVGLDETKLAAKFNGLLNRLSKPRTRSEKLLLEVLKECGKLLEAYPTQRAAPSDPVAVQFVANVPRPARAGGPDQGPGRGPEKKVAGDTPQAAVEKSDENP